MTSRAIYGSGLLELKPDTPPGAVKEYESGLKGGMAKVGTVVGTALAASIAAAVAAGAAAVVAAIGQEATGDKAAARLGLSEPDAARLGQIAGEAYMGNFGESMVGNQSVVADAWKAFGDVGDESLQEVTEGALTLADVFDQDVNQVIAAAQEILSSGLAPDAEAAMDLVGEAFRTSKGPVDEVIASVIEYSDFYADLGFTGEQVLGALSSEWATNQYAIDKVGDTVKEFGIKLADGTAAPGLEELGLDFADVQAAFAEGGPAAQEAFGQIVTALSEVEDPLEAARLGAEIMGTPYEDLAANAVPILSDLVAGVGEVGDATGEIADQAYDNIQGRLGGAWRSVSQTVVEKVGGAILPHITKITDWATEKLPGLIQGFSQWLPGAISTASGFITNTLVPAFQRIVDVVGNVISWWQNLSPESKKLIGTLAAAAGAAILTLGAALKLVEGFRAVMAAFNAMKLLMAANPWLLLIAAIVALVVLIVTNWDTIVAALKTAWDWIKRTAASVGTWIKDRFLDAVNFLVGLFLNFTPLGLIIQHFDTIKTKVTEVKDWFVDRFNDVVGFFTELPGRLTTAAGDLFAFLRDAFKSAVNWVIRKWNAFSIGFDLPELLGGGRIQIDTPNIPLLHAGLDRVPGGVHDEMLAILQGGEQVLSRAEVAQANSMREGKSLSIEVATTGDARVLAREISREAGLELRMA